MRTPVVLAALLLGVLALALPAAAEARSVTYRAKVEPASAAKRGHDRAGRVRGKAKLVDAARRDRVRIVVRGLVRGARYTWSLRTAPAGANACAGEPVRGFRFRALRRGRGRAQARGFGVASGAGYAVVVTDASGRDVACGTFRTTMRSGDDGDDYAHDHGGDDAVEDEAGDELDDVSVDDEPDDDDVDDLSPDDEDF